MQCEQKPVYTFQPHSLLPQPTLKVHIKKVASGLPWWSSGLDSALCAGDLGEQEITFRRPSFRDWAQNIDMMAAHLKYRQVSWEDAPCLGCLPLLCSPQWVLAGLGLSRLFWGPVFTRSRAPVHILVLSCSLSWENLDCHVTFFSI